MEKMRIPCGLLFMGLVVTCLATFPYLTIGDTPASPKTIIVPDNYLDIQAAIGNASSGDTIFVRNGVYKVQDYYGVLIDKPLTLIGEDNQNTIINASKPYYPHQMIRITADNVTVSGFNINGGGLAAGIIVEDSYSHVPIGCKIVGNNIHNCESTGIIAYGSTNTFTGEIKYLPSYLTIKGNTITENKGYGIYMSASNSTITENIIDSNNNVGIIVDECLFVNITNNRISNNGLAPYSENQSGGVWLRWWGPFYVTGNNITGNHGHGIGFGEFCNNSTISENEISYNNIGVCKYLVMYAGKSNFVYQNNIIGNQRQVVVNQSLYSANNYTQVDAVAFNSSHTGNYWSDYFTRYPNACEVASSGIGDTPYVVDSNNIDYHPLVQQVDSEQTLKPSPTPTVTPTSIATPTPSPSTNPKTNPAESLITQDSPTPTSIIPEFHFAAIMTLLTILLLASTLISYLKTAKLHK